jgi:D-glucosaminate-6-phosphate ammonia-lyase
MAAALQHLDFDVLWDHWSPPPALIDKARLKGVPQHGIGRTCKVGKEQIIGLLTALELFLAEGDAARHRRWKALAEAIATGLDGLPGCTVRLDGIESANEVPRVLVTLGRGAKMSAIELVTALQNGVPSIAADPTRYDEGIVILDPVCLQLGEPEQIAAAIHRLLRQS